VFTLFVVPAIYMLVAHAKERVREEAAEPSAVPEGVLS
jgi:hypothetical protein